MEPTGMIMLAVSFLFAFLASWLLLMPFFSETIEAAEDTSLLERSNLHLQKETVLSALEDLEQDFLAKKIPEEDYLSQKEELTARAVELVAQLSSGEQQESREEKVRSAA